MEVEHCFDKSSNVDHEGEVVDTGDGIAFVWHEAKKMVSNRKRKSDSEGEQPPAKKSKLSYMMSTFFGSGKNTEEEEAVLEENTVEAFESLVNDSISKAKALHPELPTKEAAKLVAYTAIGLSLILEIKEKEEGKKKESSNTGSMESK
jgi:hypothetical protein